AIVNAAAAISAEVIEDCCAAEYCPTVICPPCDSCCPDCPRYEPCTCITTWIRTCKNSYRVGEPITITYHVSALAKVNITDYTADGRSTTNNLGTRGPGTYSISGTIGPPGGPEILLLKAEPPSGCTAYAIAVFQVIEEEEPKVRIEWHFGLPKKEEPECPED
ncbi:hypothetical protein KAX17_14105, partial [Candidatus Bipolaricaulota bacterium]|nr:hypothetical protein [Candidatus Bipolaricaulota bacterium]